MSSQTARNVLRNLLQTDITKDGSIKTALEIAIEDIDTLMIKDWHEGRVGNGLELREYLGYTEDDYIKYVMKIKR